MKHLFKTARLTLWVCVMVQFSILLLYAQDEDQWQQLETKHTILHYKSFADLKKFSAKINFSPGGWGRKNLIFKANEDLTKRITTEVDALLERVQEILNMPKKMQKIIVRICPDNEQLHAFFSYFSDRTYNGETPPRAWYCYSRNTIYINADDIHEGILAHEIAHAVVDHHLMVRPSKDVAEIIARYVEARLFF
ncbi:hypothetical protein ACFL9U_16945 [Thermodesulfobacteriota bacterium]